VHTLRKQCEGVDQSQRRFFLPASLLKDDIRLTLTKNEGRQNRANMKTASTGLFLPWILRASVILGYGIIVLSGGCQSGTQTITPTRTDMVESVYASGRVMSRDQYAVYSRVPGIVKTLFVTEGASIRKGDPILLIENTSSKLSSENAQLSAAVNDYATNAAKLRTAGSALEKARVQMRHDSLQWARQKNLWEQQIGSRSELEQKALALENARVLLKQAETEYEDLDRQMRFLSEQSRTNLKIARSTEEDHLIRSETDGRVYKINVREGEIAGAAGPVAIIGKDEFVIELEIDEYDIVKVEPGQKVIVRMDSYPSEVFQASLSRIYPIMNESSRTFRAEAVFTESPPVLYPYLTLEASIVIGEKKDALTIPTHYLVNDTSVLLEDGSARTVRTGLKDLRIVEISSGLNADDRIKVPNP
jgi:HlyD family secretion protein